MQFTITPCKGRNGKRTWKLEYRLNDERYRPRFKTRELAEAERDRVAAQVGSDGKAWVALKDHERIELMAVHREVQAAGQTLRAVWEEFKRIGSRRVKDQKVGEAYKLFMAECQRRNLSPRRRAALKSNVGRFVKPRPAMLAAAVTRDQLVEFLLPFKDETFNTYRRCLYTFFEWCKTAQKCVEENPVASIPFIEERHMEKFDVPPHVLHYDQCVALFKATLEIDPGLIRFTALCLQAGVRPEREAPGVQPGDIGKNIHIRARKAKDRQERFIAIVPALAEWLALPLDDEPGPPPALKFQGPSAGDWPIKNLRKRFTAVREKAGLIKIEVKSRPWKKGDGVKKVGQIITNTGWDQDCLRHTFASAYYAVHGAEATIEALGHGDYDMLFGHYRRLMSKEEGQKILSITPAVIAR